jgi:L-ascorbate metabolism protein UlaG (beta-lactamase superfamily)
MIFSILFFLAALVLVYILFMQQPQFGRNPAGKWLSRILESPNFRNGSFQNPTPTEMILKDTSFLKLIWASFNKPASVKPPGILPSVKTDLKNLPAENPVIVWFGHSSYLIQSKGFRILVDPVLKGNASPVPFLLKPFAGSDVYSLDEFPTIDLVLLTHDHYDHLHYESIKQLSGTVRYFYTSLGVASHLERWGVAPEKITEFDWWETKTVAPGIELTATPARHFSGRTFRRGTTLWSSFVLKIHDYQLFLGGDSGYENHFKEIGSKYGPFDIAILECGQYGKNWPYIHMLPEQTAQAAKDLNAKVLMPVHWAKFELAFHPWDDSIKRVTKAAAESNQPITTPMIGEPVILNTAYPHKTWWTL